MHKNVLYFLLFFISFVTLSNNLEKEYQHSLKILEEGSLEEAKSEALDFLSSAKGIHDKLYLIKAYYLLGYISKEMNDYGDAVIYYLEGARFAESAKQPEAKNDLISIYKNLADIMRNYSHFELAHKFINKGLNIAKTVDDQNQVKSLLINRVYYLVSESKYEQVLNEINRIENKYSFDSARLISLKNKSGIAHQKLGNLDQAISSYNFIINGTKKNRSIYAHALHNIGVIEYENGKYANALKSFQAAIDFKKETGQHRLLLISLKGAAETCIRLQQHDQAISFLQEAEALEVGDVQPPETHGIYKLLSTVYNLKNDTETALKYNYVYSQRLEEFISEQKQIEELDKKFNIQLLTERYFDLLAANKKQKETETIAKIGVGATATFFILLICRIYYKRYRVKRTLEEEIRKIELLSDV